MAKRFGRKVSDTIEEKLNTSEPVLPDYLVLFFQAFKNLDRQRPTGFGVGYIPYLDIIQYARLYDMSQEVEEDLVFFVTGLDDHYIKMVNNDMKTKQEQSRNSNKKH